MAKKKFESVGRALSLAGRLAPPIGAGALGAAAGGLGARFLAAKYAPEHYLTKKWVPYAVGALGAALGTAAAVMPLINLRTEAGREKAYKATLPLALTGMSVVGGILAFGPKLWHWFAAKYPSVASLISPTSSAPQLTAGPSETSKAEQSATRASRTVTRVARSKMIGGRSGGLSPDEWSQLEQRAAGFIGAAEYATAPGASDRWIG